jgi:hypothetical protein
VRNARARWGRIAGGALLGLLALAAQAVGDRFEITNATGYEVVRLEVSPTTAANWGEDLLDGETFTSGTTRVVPVPGDASARFDVRLTDTDGDTYSFHDVDVTRTDLVVTLDDLDRVDAGMHVVVVNETDRTLLRLYVSPVSSGSWEEDVLGDEVLAPGEAFRVDLRGYDSPLFDVRADDDAGASYTYEDVNVLSADVAVRPEHRDDTPVQSEPDFHVEVFNATGYTILFLQVSPASADSWEEDVLGDDVLAPGTSRRVDLFGYDSPIFDVRATDEDGDTYSFFGIDVSEQDVVVTLDDLDQ